jgi:hypothetical protein
MPVSARARGYGEADIPRLACDRFGDADEIAREIARVHRFDRGMRFMAHSLMLVSASLAMVAVLILGIQLVIAIWSGTGVRNAFPHMREQLISLISLTLGYAGPEVGERLFQRRALIKAFALNCLLFSLLFLSAGFGLHVMALSSVLAFVSGAAVRLLQRSMISPAWILGTAIPMLLFSLAAAPFGKGSGHFQAGGALVRWSGITLACYMLTLLSRSWLRPPDHFR